jgi:hypothetical protein
MDRWKLPLFLSCLVSFSAATVTRDVVRNPAATTPQGIRLWLTYRGD